eukprot:CAMPEP_0172464634 /NCGR_PEP_ID=MMETSP1065-20121228/51018_1 /TAXON_ID=265537 /ORGANISM="Amphiprora paludosa, Strain CCMP125" /LENGTH=123 /DNA_ID=CAMNT_0013220915 /DNA_START=356 /DNA_END=724 /DNA_ORIENTATION=+
MPRGIIPSTKSRRGSMIVPKNVDATGTVSLTSIGLSGKSEDASISTAPELEEHIIALPQQIKPDAEPIAWSKRLKRLFGISKRASACTLRSINSTSSAEKGTFPKDHAGGAEELLELGYAFWP